MNKKILLILFFISMFSCATKEEKEVNIAEVVVTFFKYPPVSSIPIECGMLPYSAEDGNEGMIEGYELYADTLLDDPKLLKKIEEQINLLKIDTNSNCEFNSHIQCFINYKNGLSKLLCLGTFDGICFNGISMFRNDTLSYLIKKNIDFYTYNKEIMDLFSEYEMFENGR